MSGDLTMLEEELQAMGADPAEWRNLLTRIRELSPQLLLAARTADSQQSAQSRLMTLVRNVNSPNYGPIPAVLLAIQAREAQQQPVQFVAEVGALLRRLTQVQTEASYKECECSSVRDVPMSLCGI